jgi:FKBP-type peptidyl-prolyl cis-trans isomerase SlyD
MISRFISFHYTLKDKAGKEIDSSHDGDPMTYVEGASQIIPGLESGIQGLKTGDKKKIMVPAEDAYGARDERLVMEVPLTELPQKEKIKVGTQFDVELQDDTSHVFQVTKITSTHATLDGNHPLAGEDLFFDVEVKEARKATKEELSAAEEAAKQMDSGHDHGDGEHCH